MIDKILDALFGGGNISPQHQALRSMRLAIGELIKQQFAEFDALSGSPVPTQVVQVCQFPERECETIYVMGASGNIMRIRIDGAPQEKADEFMAGEPAIEYRSVKVPDDASDLLKGDMGL